MRAVALLMVCLLAGCSSSSPEAQAPLQETEEEEDPSLAILYFNRTLQNVPFYGIDGTPFLVAGPGPARVPEQIFTWEAPGELVEGHVRLTWSSATPVEGLVFTMENGGTAIAQAQGTGPLEFPLEGQIDGANLWIEPTATADAAGAHLVVKWTLEITSKWLVDEAPR